MLRPILPPSEDHMNCSRTVPGLPLFPTLAKYQNALERNLTRPTQWFLGDIWETLHEFLLWRGLFFWCWPCADLHLEIPMHAPIAKQVFSQSSVCVSVTSSLGTNSSDADVYTEPCFLWFQVKDGVMRLNTCGYLVYLALRLRMLLGRREGDICLHNVTKEYWRTKQSYLVACNVRDVLYSLQKAWGAVLNVCRTDRSR